ncbi:MAG: NAD-dependent epimerase/dehydratase family protein, partial [Gammaproteobacteria bacterium]
LAARKPDLSWYASSKFEGEQSLRELAGAMPWTIFRPTAVYGPGDRELTPLFRLTRFGILPVTVSSSARFGLLYVDDLVAAILSWLKASSVPAGVYELDDGTPGGYDQGSVAAICSEIWGRAVYILPLPVVLIRVLAQINLVAARLLGYSPMLTPGKVEELQHPDWVCDINPLTEALGWLPAISLREGMKQAVLGRK